jgi:prophage regulatory protein
MSNQLLRLPDVLSKVGLSRSTIYDRMEKGTFPKSISIGVNSVAWVEGDIDAWIDNQIRNSRGSPV